LLGKAVTQKKSTGVPTTAKTYTATYVDDTGKLVGLAICDVPLAACAGAALALIPAGAAAEATRAGQLPAEMFDNLREVLNVIASLFVGTHVRLREVMPPSAAVPTPVATLMARPGARLDLDLAVAGYSGGRLSFMLS
jgi:hypothetical protein